MLEAVKSAGWILAFLCTLAYMQTKDASEQAEYIQALEKIVTKCTARGDNPITVDGEIWMCGATPTGVKSWR